jgi:hypothetical protein
MPEVTTTTVTFPSTVSQGRSNGLWHCLGLPLTPVVIRVLAVEETGERDHAIEVGCEPAGAGLVKSASDEMFTGPFDQSAADRSAGGETLGIVQSIPMMCNVSRQRTQGLLPRGADRRGLRLLAQALESPITFGQQRLASLVISPLRGAPPARTIGRHC